MLEPDPEIRPNATECLNDEYFAFKKDNEKLTTQLGTGEELSKYKTSKSRKTKDLLDVTPM